MPILLKKISQDFIVLHVSLDRSETCQEIGIYVPSKGTHNQLHIRFLVFWGEIMGDQYISANAKIMIADRPRQRRPLSPVNILGRRKRRNLCLL